VSDDQHLSRVAHVMATSPCHDDQHLSHVARFMVTSTHSPQQSCVSTFTWLMTMTLLLPPRLFQAVTSLRVISTRSPVVGRPIVRQRETRVHRRGAQVNALMCRYNCPSYRCCLDLCHVP
jgi:hypothetical protein